MRAFICINGILNNPGESDGWTDRATTWLNLHTEGKAEKFEYAAGIVTRRLWQQERAQAIARMCGFYDRAGYAITLIGHSNGCDLIARVLKLVEGDMVIESAHLIAAAADGDDYRFPLGITLDRLHLYGSVNDQALQQAALSRRLLGWAGLGYGSLGLLRDAWIYDNERVSITRRDTYGHSEWFERGENFERTMQLIISHEK